MKLIAIFFTALLLGSPLVQAALIAYDNFSYTAGATIGGQNGGSGWTGAWATNGMATNYSASTALTYSNGSVEVVGDTRTALVGSNTADLYARAFAPQTSTLYFSFLFRLDSNTLNVDDFVHFMLNNDTSNDTSGGIGLLSTTTNRLGARIGTTNGGDTTSSAIDLAANTTYFLVGKIWKNGGANYNTVDLFINPSSNIEPGTSSATDTVTMTMGTISYFTVRGFNIDADDRYVFDELRIGDTFASVVVPEPSVAALILGGAAMLIAGRRRPQTPKSR